MKVVEQDLFDVQRGIICHQVNNVGAFDAGIAKTFRDKYPETARKYREMCTEYFPNELLGKVQLVRISDNLVVANIFGQTLEAKPRNTSYDATAEAWDQMYQIAYDYGCHTEDGTVEHVYVPYLMGCGLGGGEWSIYEAIVDTHCPGVVACKLV